MSDSSDGYAGELAWTGSDDGGAVNTGLEDEPACRTSACPATGDGCRPACIAVARSHARHSAYSCLRFRSASYIPANCDWSSVLRKVPAAENASTCVCVGGTVWALRTSCLSARAYTESANCLHTAKSVAGSTSPAEGLVVSSFSMSCARTRWGRRSGGAAMPCSTACSRPGGISGHVG